MRKISNDTLLKNRKKFVEKLSIEKNDEYELVGKYTNQRTKTTFKHKVCGTTWETKPHVLISAKGTNGCPHCQYKAKSYTTREFYALIDSSTKGEYTVKEGQKYINNRVKYSFVHNVCGTEFTNLPYSVIKNSISCPTCLKKVTSPKKRSKEQFIEEMRKSVGDTYKLVGDYVDALVNVKVLHTSCNKEFYIRPYHILKEGRGCPACSKNLSSGELLVKEFLDSLGVSYEREFTFDNCMYKNKLRFDFKIDTPYGICIIEYDGEQHTKPVEYFGGEKAFHLLKTRDKIKDNYCQDNNIPLLRIPHTLDTTEVKNKIMYFIQSVSKAETP